MRKAILLFLLVALAQWAVPLCTIAGRERVLHEETPFKFKLRPVDPSDPFRGEYVVLSFACFQGPFDVPPGAPAAGEISGYAVLQNGDDGFAQVQRLTLEKPDAGDYVPVHGYAYGTGTLFPQPLQQVHPAFDRYYLEEGGGRVAEDLVRWRPDTLGQREAYALVRVWKGEAVIEDLIIDGRPVRAWIDAADTVTTAP